MAEFENTTIVDFLGQFGLKRISVNHSNKILANLTPPTVYESILDENNRTITVEYGTFRIKKDKLELFLFKDYDFAGKDVVCLKCYQKFDSKMSYCAHVGTDFCTRSNYEPNPVYLKFKKKNGGQYRKRNNLKFLEDKKLLNPEMLDTLQTRNNCYPDKILERVKNKKKQVYNKNNDCSVKKIRGKPEKNIELEPTKRGRLVMSSTPSDGNPSPNKNKKSLNKKIKLNQEDNSESSHEIMLKKPKIVSISSVDAYINNDGKSEKPKSVYSEKKFLTDWAWRIISSNKGKDYDIKRFQSFILSCNQTPSIKKEGNNLFLNGKLTGSILKSLKDKYLKNKDTWNQDICIEEINSIFSKLEEIGNENKTKDKKTDNLSGSITDKEKKSIELTEKQCKYETDVSMIKNHINKNKECEEIRLNQDHVNSVPKFLPVISNIDSASKESILTCTVCGKEFVSNDECKVYHLKHITISNQENNNNGQENLSNQNNFVKIIFCRTCNK